MKLRHLTSAVTAAVLTAATFAATTAPAQSTGQTLGTRSLAKVLAADGHGFDSNWRDFDVYDYFVVRVLAAKPDSAVRILYQGGRRVTAFMPTDGAYRRAAEVIVEHRYNSEARLARAMWRAGGSTPAERADTVESFMLYSLVQGRTLTSNNLKALAPTRLKTMQGGYVRIRYHDGAVFVLDFEKDSPTARVIVPDINKGNRQVGHGVNTVLSSNFNP